MKYTRPKALIAAALAAVLAPIIGRAADIAPAETRAIAEEKIGQYLDSGQKMINGWKVGSLFGDALFYNGDWLKRAAAAEGGIYGNNAVEAMASDEALKQRIMAVQS
jgi:hypothetical protein